jgi:hypothetical protein
LTRGAGARAPASQLADDGDHSVTTIVSRRVKPGHEVFYEQFLEGIIAEANGFPGHLGVEVFRPETATAGEYRIVYRFDNAQHLRQWLDSDEHAAWLERAEPHAIGPVSTSFVTGLESWFTLPGRHGALPPLEDLPVVLRLGITTAVAVPLIRGW